MSTSKLSNGCVDVLVVQQQDKSFKSTPFQIAFASIKFSNKTKQVTIEVNGVKSMIKMYVSKDDIKPKFQRKKILRRDYYPKTPSDSEELSDDDRSQRSLSRERTFSPNRPVVDTTVKLPTKSQKLEALKNEAVPTRPSKLWPFAWLSKKREMELVKEEQKKQTTEPNMQSIQQEIYEGEESSTDPQFLLSLCGDLLRKDKNSTSKEILQIFHSKQLKYKDFLKDPVAYLANQDLVVKIDESIYSWDLGLAIITSRLAFGKKMPDSEISKMMERKKSWLGNYFSAATDKRKYVIESDEYGRPLGDKKIERQMISGKSDDGVYIKYSKTPTSQQLKNLGLKKGPNLAKFTLDETGETVECHIYLWDYKTKIVVSDIDGTITKTDVFGQLMPALNQTWIHDGVVNMFNKIENNGYQIIYLTARAIVQYEQTRSFLFNFVKQNEQRLPLGPVFTSPDGLVSSFKREMIDKQPDFLKTQILTVIRENFPVGKNPLVAGFGNKTTDAKSYKNSGIKLDKIFIIGQNSIVNMITSNDFKTSYNDIANSVDKYFPKVQKEPDERSTITSSEAQPSSKLQQIILEEAQQNQSLRFEDEERDTQSNRKDSDSIDNDFESSFHRRSSHGSPDLHRAIHPQGRQLQPPTNLTLDV